MVTKHVKSRDILLPTVWEKLRNSPEEHCTQPRTYSIPCELINFPT